MKIGFTGTREGMNKMQKKNFTYLLNSFSEDMSIAEFHHGDCVGADADAHKLILDFNDFPPLNSRECEIHIHPPKDDSLQAKCEGFCKYYKPATYLARNRNIVDSVDIMVAVSATPHEILKGGTWYTINYARRNKVPVWILYPNGKVEKQ